MPAFKMYYRKLKDSLFKKIYKGIYKPGHFYHPAPDIENIRKNEEKIFQKPDTLPGINIHAQQQISLAEGFKAFNSGLQFIERPDIRYRVKNDFFVKPDALALFYLFNKFKPKRIFEIGSGFSSALMLDINEQFFNNQLKLTFIEPYPQRLFSLMRDTDYSNVSVKESFVQDVSLDLFDELEKNDILFIDSSHVSKAGSDVNHNFFKILPCLKTGVLIHIHDIAWPFEYPKELIYQGTYWNEAYLLKSFLMFNNSFEIIWFNDYLYYKQHNEIKAILPDFINSGSGGSIWLRKIEADHIS